MNKYLKKNSCTSAAVMSRGNNCTAMHLSLLHPHGTMSHKVGEGGMKKKILHTSVHTEDKQLKLI
jgi:hypothetical protein